ncbi:MATE family efflux transporter [Mycoplasmopsis alligatoris]|uniref:MATE domain protein n=1 Tax=Mycoplasmopsis alligatoris A21JP2 TaxID=747682 RepID=D4XWG6_9BACT|nr:MATE family efflux transporter [Mycoplasmopsis alligatoris]EFF41239.1 MATE domain protein [Mycoplasmopsis alligatoris A21JP2]
MDNSKIDKQSRAKFLFEKMDVKKAVWIVAIPGLLTSFMIGLYTFLNQVFILNFVPKTIPILNGDIPNSTDTGIIYDYLSSWNKAHFDRADFDVIFRSYVSYLNGTEGITKISGDSIATISVNATFPFSLFSGSIIFLIPVGASVYYTKCISKKLEATGKDLWSTCFYTTIFVSILTALIMYIAMWCGLLDSLLAKPHFNTYALSQLDSDTAVKGILNKYSANHKASEIFQDYYNACQTISLSWAKLYIYIFGAGTLIQGIYVLISYLIRSEGKNAYVMYWAIGANIAGIAFNALFIIVFKMGVLGGVLATIIGWTINLLAYIAYIYVNNKRGTTWISIHHLISFKFRLKFLAPISLLGLSAFLRSFGIAVALFIITFLLGRMPFTEGSLSIYNWSKASPVVTLFFLALFGISDGIRSILSYNYAKRNFAKCNEIFKWAMIITFIYAFTVTLIAIALAPQFLWMLNTTDMNGSLLSQTSGPVAFLRITIWRLFFYAFAIGGILLFQGTNNIKMSLIVTSMESLITFGPVIGIAIASGYALHNAEVGLFYSSLVIPMAFAVNSVVAGLTIFFLSIRFLKKVMPNIDNIKLSWSRKIEHDFFEKAEKEECSKN